MDSHEGFVLIPDFEALTSYDHLGQLIDDASKSISWNKKCALPAYWRGSTTGGQYSASDNAWMNMTR